MEKCYITFPSIYHAFRAKKILKEAQVESDLTAVPRELSEACEGLALYIKEADLQIAVDMLGAKGVIMLKKGVRVAKIF